MIFSIQISIIFTGSAAGLLHHNHQTGQDNSSNLDGNIKNSGNGSDNITAENETDNATADESSNGPIKVSIVKNYPWYMVHFIFFRNKMFLFVKIESWNFQQLFDLEFRETLSAHSNKHLDDIFVWVIKSCLNKMKSCKVSRNSDSILTNKFLKKIEVYHLPWIALISAKRWRLDALTFVIHGFVQIPHYLYTPLESSQSSSEVFGITHA